MPAQCGKIKGVLTVIKKGDTIPGIFSLIIGGFTLIYIHQNPKMVVLGGTDGAGVGPGFFPFICAVALIICGVLLTIRGIRQHGEVDYFMLTEEKKNNLKIGALLSGFILIFLIAWKISEMFFLILPVYVFAVNKLFRRSMIFSLLFTIGMTLFVYGLFAKGFTIRFMP